MNGSANASKEDGKSQVHHDVYTLLLVVFLSIGTVKYKSDEVTELLGAGGLCDIRVRVRAH